MSTWPETVRFDFLTPSRIVFGWGRSREIGRHGSTLGRRALLVCGSRTLQQRGAIAEMQELLQTAGVESELIAMVGREPEVDDVDAGAAALAQRGVTPEDFIIAVGGGSAIDLGKALAAMATNGHGSTVQDFLEGVGRGLPLTERPLPLLAVPTTAGTGSEATKNAVISSYEPPFKKSLRSEYLVPAIVLIDPELTTSVPKNVTVRTGMDAMTQLIESYLSRRAEPIPEALCLKGLELAVPAVERAAADGQDRPARERMALAATLSGMALANSGLGMAHGVAAALGVHARVPHGLACAVMLPSALRANRDVRTDKLARLGALFTCQKWSPDIPERERRDLADRAVDFIQQLCVRLGIPDRLSQLGVVAEQIPQIVKSSRGNSMNGNPRELSDEELTQILEAML